MNVTQYRRASDAIKQVLLSVSQMALLLIKRQDMAATEETRNLS